eukprot:6207652-Pleurochrysis_carterae.AAC.4
MQHHRSGSSGPDRAALVIWPWLRGGAAPHATRLPCARAPEPCAAGRDVCVLTDVGTEGNWAGTAA